MRSVSVIPGLPVMPLQRLIHIISGHARMPYVRLAAMWPLCLLYRQISQQPRRQGRLSLHGQITAITKQGSRYLKNPETVQRQAHGVFFGLQVRTSARAAILLFHPALHTHTRSGQLPRRRLNLMQRDVRCIQGVQVRQPSSRYKCGHRLIAGI